LAGPVWLAETLPYKWRAVGLAVFYDLYYLGKLLFPNPRKNVVFERKEKN